MEKKQITEAKEQLVRIMRNPVKVRFAVVGMVLAIGYVAVFSPLDKKIKNCSRDLSKEKTRTEMAQQIVHFRQEVVCAGERVMKCDELNEWSESILEATRGTEVVVRNMERSPTKRLGPYYVLAMKLELESTYKPLLKFMRDLEEPSRLNRIDQVRIKRETESLYITLDILGLVEMNESES